MLSLISYFSFELQCHFIGKKDHLELLHRHQTSAEDWFRVEIVRTLSRAFKVTSVGKETEPGNQPDVVIERPSGDKLYLEIKSLPTTNRFPSASGRFSAGDHNKKDFARLRDGQRDAILYVYWPDPKKWMRCRAKLRREFSVEPFREFAVPISGGHVVFTLWLNPAYLLPLALCMRAR